MDEGLSITKLTRQTHVSIPKLLDWEAKGIVTPLFKKTGSRITRFYSPALVQKIGRLKALLGDGYRLSRAVEIVESEAAGVKTGDELGGK
jgi:DNA-binding transcriptional MerR regulator